MQCVEDQYDNFKVLQLAFENKTVDGKFTLEDNMADIMGLITAYNAYKQGASNHKAHNMRGLEQYNNDQLFFIAFAQVKIQCISLEWKILPQISAYLDLLIRLWKAECGNNSLEELRYNLVTDPHSPAMYRVLGPLQNFKEFSTVWGCSRESNMFQTHAGTCNVI